MDRAPIVFPIRFATHNIAVQTTTRELSRSGVYVRCLEPPPVSTELSMRLYLPGQRAGLEVDAVVREVSQPGTEPGFWADFSALSPADKVQINEVLARRERAADAKPIGAVEVQPLEDPRRAFPRHVARFAVRFASVNDFVLEYAANISAGGIFVHTATPPPLKTVVRVEMELPGSSEPVAARGMVVHHLSSAEALAKGVLPGMGVQFIDADDQFRERIDAAIDHILKA